MSSPRRWSRATVGVLYGGLLTATVLAFASHEWGATTHSLIAIVAISVVTVHVYTQRRWVRGVVQRGLRHPQRALMVANALLVACFAIVNVSGFPVWLWGVGGPVLVMHELSGFAFLPLLAAHLVLNRRRVTRLLKRRRVRTIQPARVRQNG